MNLLANNQLNSSLRHIIVPFTIFNLFQMYYDLDTELSYQCDPGYKRKGFQVAQCFFYNGTARHGILYIWTELLLNIFS